ncbi:TlyA family rRNA (cytidine-2'-O)-methyltransferase [Reticulibacter mediterranei]|uniref:TlyA family rRNA (Cytidine-2'-O)-methyltransferase n=1 Tax=Reticulibacter mediterranei TaxID=2778369 RepID=A0A8J3N0Q6_9CHLR|nr:TlyA family RNA methyltransferase [Reticulibacter mediterranei]GHO91763.1 TlyA family rRNA (cytidine-2'-O)-methyltransferase [Reticulibacter mediterranei]
MPSFLGKAEVSTHTEFHDTSQYKKQTQPGRKVPLADLLVEVGLFEHIDEAKRWIMAGKVLVNDQRFDKPSMKVRRDAKLRVLGRSRYASRGGYKLETALEHFAIDVSGQVALDCGASTGGFTDCLLQHSAAYVYAVEVGYGQLAGSLRVHPQVKNLERTNLSDLTPAMLDPAPMLITLDLSYLSLTKALPIAAPLLAPKGLILALVKPLFEVESAEARRSGHIDDPTLLITALQRVLDAGTGAGFTPLGTIKLALQPRHGVMEFIALFSKGHNCTPYCYTEETLATLVADVGVGKVDIE